MEEEQPVGYQVLMRALDCNSNGGWGRWGMRSGVGAIFFGHTKLGMGQDSVGSVGLKLRHFGRSLADRLSLRNIEEPKETMSL